MYVFFQLFFSCFVGIFSCFPPVKSTLNVNVVVVRVYVSSLMDWILCDRQSCWELSLQRHSLSWLVILSDERWHGQAHDACQMTHLRIKRNSCDAKMLNIVRSLTNLKIKSTEVGASRWRWCGFFTHTSLWPMFWVSKVCFHFLPFLLMTSS